MRAKSILAIAVGMVCAGSVAKAGPFFFSTGDPNGAMASASRPDSPGKFEIESADDFLLTDQTNITSATFTGLIPRGATITDVRVEIYRVFPKDSTNPPSGNVTTRVNSPSDVAFDERESTAGDLSFTTTLLSTNFTAANSVQPGGIHALPGSTTDGDGPVSGEETKFTINFTTPFDLPADHYFFIPQVALSGANDNFLWLSGQRPPVTPLSPDLQSWTRDANLDPDWVRIGTDIVGGSAAPAPTFNGAFSLNGDTIPPGGGGGTPAPLPPGIWVGLLTAAGLGAARARRKRA